MKTILNRWSSIAFGLGVISLIVHSIKPTVLHFSVLTFILSLLFSLLLWNLLGLILKTLPNKIALLLKFTIAFILPLLITIGIKTYIEFSVFTDHNLMTLALDDPTYLLNVSTVFFSNIWVIIGFSISVFLIFKYLIRTETKILNKTNANIKIALLIVVVAIGQNQFQVRGYSDFTTIDSSFLFAYKLTQKETKELTKSNQRLSPQKGNESEYNIVLVVQESMSVEPLSFYGYDNCFTPFFKEWITKEDSNFVLFTDAMAISGCTDISVPALYTGVGPEEGYNKLLTLPFMWDYAKANTYETALVSSQRYSWRNLRSFLNNEGLDLIRTSEDTDLRTVNDLGVDDVAVSLWINKFIKNRKQEKPLFLVYNSNALHRPYQRDSDLLDIPDEIDKRYGRALYIIDKSIENIYNAFVESGEIDKTIFIFTADHGDYTANRIQRMSSFLKEALQIPIMIRFPDSWIKENQEKYRTLMSNEKIRISNLDLYPTIIEILQSQKTNTQLYDSLNGTSLFSKINNSRTITCLSTNETRKWSNDGFGLYHDSLSYILDSFNEEQLYNLIQDNSQTNNIIKTTNDSFLLRYYQLIQDNDQLNKIYQGHRHSKE